MDYSSIMQRCLVLASEGIPGARPNPYVGCVIVKDGTIISEGYHATYGSDHAEINALRKTNVDVNNATLVVNLEPCCHYGHTPPCTDAILEAGISKVVYGCKDPNPRVSGSGIDILEKAGIEVIGPVLEKDCILLNSIYFINTLQKRPYVILKIAQTLDGYIATTIGTSKWITNLMSRAYVRQLRTLVDAILVGSGTVRTDNPQLYTSSEKYQPKRIILTESGILPTNVHLLTDKFRSSTIFYTASFIDSASQLRTSPHVGIVDSTQNKRTPETQYAQSLTLMNWLWNNHIGSVLVEGGATVFDWILRSSIVDQLIVFIAPRLFGIGKHGFSTIKQDIYLHDYQLHSIKRFEDDLCLTFLRTST